jgi:hypothetical protein
MTRPFDKSDSVESASGGLDLRSELRANGLNLFNGFDPFVVSHFGKLRTGLSNHKNLQNICSEVALCTRQSLTTTRLTR